MIYIPNNYQIPMQSFRDIVENLIKSSGRLRNRTLLLNVLVFLTRRFADYCVGALLIR